MTKLDPIKSMRKRYPTEIEATRPPIPKPWRKGWVDYFQIKLSNGRYETYFIEVTDNEEHGTLFRAIFGPNDELVAYAEDKEQYFAGIEMSDADWKTVLNVPILSLYACTAFQVSETTAPAPTEEPENDSEK